LSDRVLRQIMAPRFRNGDFDGGVERAVSAIIDIIEGEYTAPPPERQPHASSPMSDLFWLAVLFFVFFVFGPAFIWGRAYRGRMTGSGNGWSRWGGPGGFGGWG